MRRGPGRDTPSRATAQTACQASSRARRGRHRSAARSLTRRSARSKRGSPRAPGRGVAARGPAAGRPRWEKLCPPSRRATRACPDSLKRRARPSRRLAPRRRTKTGERLAIVDRGPEVRLRSATANPVRRRDRGGAHLLLAARDRAGRDHRAPAPQHRSAHLRRRTSHGVPARDLRVRALGHLAAAGLVLPARLPVLQHRAAEPALRAARRDRGARAAGARGPRRARSTATRSSWRGAAIASSRPGSRRARTRSSRGSGGSTRARARPSARTSRARPRRRRSRRRAT